MTSVRELVPTGASFRLNRQRALGPQLLVDLPGGALVSIIGEVDFDKLLGLGRALAVAEWPLIPGIVELALIDAAGNVHEPMRRVPIPMAADIVRRALAGDLTQLD